MIGSEIEHLIKPTAGKTPAGAGEGVETQVSLGRLCTLESHGSRRAEDGLWVPCPRKLHFSLGMNIGYFIFCHAVFYFTHTPTPAPNSLLIKFLGTKA